ncbi:MAG: hypothetical protein E7283_08520 [Lachnospiraceae bacterium]|nr:hypothetical protein [Lachnospiraceae bacterium]
MKFNYKRIHIGRRTLKTAAAVIISIVAVSFYGVSASKMTFAMLGAMSAMENSFRRSIMNCLTQIVGMICGAAAGLLLLQLPIHWLVSIGIGIVFVITLYNVFHIPFSPGLPCLMILTICTTSDLLPFAYTMERLWDTAIGLGVGMLINVLVLPYDNSIKIRNSIEYLKEEVITFLADMFDGDNQYPDTDKLTATITEMAGQLGILSEQWFPLRRVQNARRLAILQDCEGKARQLLSHMEVLSRMTEPGCLSEENCKRLESCGAKISAKCIVRPVKNNEMQEMEYSTMRAVDVITNYHVAEILQLRQELMEDLMQFPAKRLVTQRAPIYENEYKSIYTGVSNEFGPVILKYDADIAQLKSEYHMLAKLNGHHSCRVYAFNEDKGQLLEERILPGTKLRAEKSLEKRLDAFAEVFEAIHIDVVEDAQARTGEHKLLRRGTPNYLDWLEKAYEYWEKNIEELQGAWKDSASQALTIGKELFEKYPDRVLLHGDLHHDNLLLREDGDYVFVDPKGVVGPKIFDLPRFILNELETEYDEDDVTHIKSVITTLCEKLDYPEEDVRKLFYMETVLANIWSMEDGEDVNEEYVQVAEAIFGVEK